MNGSGGELMMGVSSQQTAPESTVDDPGVELRSPGLIRNDLQGGRRVARGSGLWLARYYKQITLGALIAFFVGLGAAVSLEIETSRLQAKLISSFGTRIDYTIESGASTRIRFPEDGPYDRRLGYAHLPVIIDGLTHHGYSISSQARVSDAFLTATDLGLYPIYRAKNQAGLEILDRRDLLIYRARFPSAVYERFEDIPPLVWQTLLHIENRTLLDETTEFRNPAVEWPRFGRALVEQVLRKVGLPVIAPGASTLSTQLEKLRHSPGGRTDSPREKLRQMATASLRAYSDGPLTLAARKRIVRDYLNSMPLAAVDGHGEVIGLADGLAMWYGADFDSVNALLTAPLAIADSARISAQAIAYRQVLSLILADRRPSFHLRQETGRVALDRSVDNFLVHLAADSVITAELRDASLGVSTRIREGPVEIAPFSFVERKAVNSVRSELLRRVGSRSLHDLDRFDLAVRSTFDGEVQTAVSSFLNEILAPSGVQSHGLQGYRLLASSDASDVAFAIVIYEATDEGNEIRIEADSFDGPFNVNSGSKLELGSSAKLRTLVTYLELVDELHGAYASLSPAELREMNVERGDNITAWAVNYLRRNPGAALRDMLDAAMRRTYSASTGEAFFTGGGMHVFSNFSSADDGRTVTVSDGFRRSVNLVFIRLMRDIVAYHVHRLPDSPTRMLTDMGDPRRMEYLARFADKEGIQFTSTYAARYRGKSEGEMWKEFTERHNLTPRRLAWAFRAVTPEADSLGFRGFMRHYAGINLTDSQIQSLFASTDPEPFNWQDRGHLAGVHPLELWLLHLLRNNPDASWPEIVSEGTAVRQEVYQWLFRSGNRAGQNNRIRTLLEEEAFLGVHERWVRVGYPFESLVPSYATSIGSSADRPGALADLVGIVLRDGMKYPAVRINMLHFAAETPFETQLHSSPPSPDRVLSPQVAAVVREALLDVVENGTAVRARNSIILSDGTSLPIGGKTGTGDNRRQVLGLRGQVVGSHVLNRTSTLVFFIGDRHFGVITVYVDGPNAARYAFTSSLPAQILKTLGPTLKPLFEPDHQEASIALTP
jgi:membrane peptidoglycan carboxypeptidase